MIAHSIPFLPSLPACRFKRWLAAISAVILTVLSVIGITAPTAQAAPTEVTATVFSAPGWDYANLRTGPGTGYAVAGTVFANSSVTLGCWIRGDSAEGPYGNSNLWYTVVSAGAAYISDAMVFTGSDEPVTEATVTIVLGLSLRHSGLVDCRRPPTGHLTMPPGRLIPFRRHD